MKESIPVVCTFRVLCDKSWDDLNVVLGNSNVRYCGDCQKPVFQCHTYKELKHHVSKSHCVSFFGRYLEPLMGDLVDINEVPIREITE